MCTDLANIESVHTFACKRYMNVPPRVPNKFVYGETGRYPLYVNTLVRSISYWLKLQRMELTRLPRQAYLMLCNMDERGKECWVTHVRNALCWHGFGYVWLQQGVGCEKAFIACFKKRLVDVYQQEWNSSVMCKDMYAHYRSFKTAFEAEPYFQWMNIKCFRDSLIKLRLGILPINGSAFRSVIGHDASRVCDYCQHGVIENEEHFVFTCPLYASLRAQYLEILVNNRMSFTDMMNCDNMDIVRNLGTFIFYACRLRTDYVQCISSSQDQ